MRISVKYKFVILIWVFIFLANLPVFSSEKQPIRVKSDRATYNNKKQEAILTGNVNFYHRDVVLSGDRAVFNAKSQEGYIRGSVNIVQPGTVISGDRMDAYYKKTTAVLSGNVSVITNKANFDEKNQNNPISSTMTAESLSYNWLAKSGIAEGNVFVIQGDRRAYGDKAVYDGNMQIITIEGNVKFEQGSNNWVTASKAVFDLQKNTILASGGVSGNFMIDAQDEKKTGKTFSTPKQTPDKLPISELPLKN